MRTIEEILADISGKYASSTLSEEAAAKLIREAYELGKKEAK